jgi:catechol 2,3-dioxygenase-like lactoylglutathione lyase family enzyme
MSEPVGTATRLDPAEYGKRIPAGLGLNLLVRDVARSARFQAEVLGARVEHIEEHFAIVVLAGSRWLLHSDWSYRSHPLRGVVAGLEARGAGIELRLYGTDPDLAEARARRCDAIVLSGAMDKEHGLREAYLVDDDGYVWVPSVALAPNG